jgi:hypothetical protein
MSQLNYTFKHSVANDRILIELHSKFGEYETILSRTVIDTQDKIIHESLVNLGWTPPGLDTVTLEYHDSVVRSAVKARVEETTRLRAELDEAKRLQDYNAGLATTAQADKATYAKEWKATRAQLARLTAKLTELRARLDDVAVGTDNSSK